MKHIFVALILCVACTQATVRERSSDREHDGFVGPVKKVFVEWSPISGGNYPVGSRCRQMTKVYDQGGRLMQHILYPGGVFAIDHVFVGSMGELDGGKLKALLRCG